MKHQYIRNLSILGIIILLICQTLSAQEQQLPAFPGAEGYGAKSLGGRGGKVFIVNNLNDDGPGSLREAIEAPQKRIIVFNISGVIKLNSTLVIRNPYITIAGQSAPEPGIILRLNPAAPFGQVMRIETHDVVMRYIKFRRGDTTRSGDNLGIVSPSKNIIIDHCSFQWATDESIAIWATEAADDKDAIGVQAVSIQNSLISDSLLQRTRWLNPDIAHTEEQLNDPTYTDYTGNRSGNKHPLGMLVGGKLGYSSWKKVKDIDIHHNVFAHNTHRNPRVTSKGFKIVNNFIYNWFTRAGATMFSSHVDYIGNIYMHGPMSYIDSNGDGIKEARKRFLRHEITKGFYNETGTAALYVHENIAPRLPEFSSADADGWDFILDETRWRQDGTVQSLPKEHRRMQELATATFPITYTKPDVSSMLDVTKNVGANQRLDCDGALVTSIDSIDGRTLRSIHAWAEIPEITNEILNSAQLSGTRFIRKSKIYQTAKQAGGYEQFEVLSSVTSCKDLDSDGMPDAWEEKYKKDFSADGDDDYDGYTNIEEFLNATNPLHAGRALRDAEILDIVLQYKNNELTDEEFQKYDTERTTLYQEIFELVDSNKDNKLSDVEVVRAMRSKFAYPDSSPEFKACDEDAFFLILSTNPNTEALIDLLELMVNKNWRAGKYLFFKGVLTSRVKEIFNERLWYALGEGYNIISYKVIVEHINKLDVNTDGDVSEEEFRDFKKLGIRGFPYKLVKRYLVEKK